MASDNIGNLVGNVGNVVGNIAVLVEVWRVGRGVADARWRQCRHES